MNVLKTRALVESVRAHSRSVLKVSQRGIFTTRHNYEASLFKMPAMSPTMIEGGVVEWKFEEGDAFSAGDVLLEIETDKAQIDVEAQDDGILAKIYARNGERNIPVGKPIAVVTEPGDDSASLELPDPSSVSAATKFTATPAAQPAESSQPAPTQKKPTTVASSGSKANKEQTLLPSVQSLLHERGMSFEEAIEKIPATGPNGRLLKGDVLVHFGSASQESMEKLNSSIKKLQKLDLSNIKIKEAVKGVKDEKAVSAIPEAVPSVRISRAFDLSDLNLLKVTADATDLSDISVKQMVEKASKLAQRDVPFLTAIKRSILNDPVFEEIIAPLHKPKPFEVSLTYEGQLQSLRTKPVDIYDVLTSKKVAGIPLRTNKSGSPKYLNVDVTVNTKVSDSEKLAKLYIDRLGFYLIQGKAEVVL